MFFHLKVSSKDKEGLEKFSRFLLKLNSSFVTIKNFPKQKRRKFVTILNSPHVNKTAQEQFEFRFYNKRFLINSFKPFSFFSLLKKAKNVSFPNVKLEIQGLFNMKAYNRKILKLVDPEIAFLNIEESLCLSLDNNLLTTKTLKKSYIQLFDGYGEVCLKNSFYFVR